MTGSMEDSMNRVFAWSWRAVLLAVVLCVSILMLAGGSSGQPADGAWPMGGGPPVLLGGWKLAEPYAGGHLNGGGLAVDWATSTLYVYVNNPNAGRVGVAVFDVPAPGAGNATENWPVLRPRAFIAAWWDSDNPQSQGSFCQGLLWDEGRLWSVTRDFYPVTPAPTTVVKATDGTRRVYPVPRQGFGNFAKFWGGGHWLACGGHETGQGSIDGPTLADLAGNVKLTYSSLLDTPGPNNEFWDTVAPRFPDHWPVNPAFPPGQDRVDYWLAWNPRDVGRGLEGRWASDHVDSGALIFPDGGYVCWPLWGTGALDYRHQNTSGSPVFAADWSLHRTAVYVYVPDGDRYSLAAFAHWPDENGQPMRNPIRGSDFGPTSDTFVVLEANAWSEHLPWNTEARVRLYRR